MIHFRYNKTTRSYRTSLDIQKNEKDFVSIKFDTGATNTIITTGALGFDDVQTSVLLKNIQEGGLKPKKFTSASGNTFMGYPCYCDNLKIGNVLLKRFYYYIVLHNNPKALLGDDFICCCTFSHSFKSDIIVTAFHSEEYEQQCGYHADSIDVFQAMS